MSPGDQVRTIGVLGGMGPAATVLFFDYLVKLTPGDRDQDHIPIIIHNNPQIPDRTEAIVNKGESPVKDLLAGAKLLEKAGADFICIPCNTAHYFLPAFESSIGIPVLNQLHCVRDAILSTRPPVGRVGLLATKGTVRSGLYQQLLEGVGMEVLVPKDDDLDDLYRVIQSLKKSERDPARIRVLAKQQVQAGAEALVLGCTELSLVADELSLDIPIFDSTLILAKTAVDLALDRSSLTRSKPG